MNIKKITNNISNFKGNNNIKNKENKIKHNLVPTTCEQKKDMRAPNKNLKIIESKNQYIKKKIKLWNKMSNFFNYIVCF